MTNQASKKISKAIFTLVICLMAVFTLPGIKSEAASKPTFKKKITMMYHKKALYNSESFTLSGIKSTTKVTYSDIVSSNPSIVEVSDYLTFTAKKTGTATVSFKAKVKGVEFSYSCKVTVVKYQNPFKKFKVGTKNYASKYKNHASPYVKYPSGGVKNKKLTITLKKKWKITKVKAHNYATNKKRTLKNKKNITLNRSGNNMERIECTVKNTKTGATFTAYLFW